MSSALAVMLGLLLVASATAGDGHWPARKLTGMRMARPSASSYHQYNLNTYRPKGLTVGVPNYNWGHFGAPQRTDRFSHVDYYGDYLQWNVRRGN